MAPKHLLYTALCGLPVLGSAVVFACSDSNDASQSPPPSGPDGSPEGDAASNDLCTAQGLPAKAFATGPFGKRRGEVADDFSLAQVDGTSFAFKASFTGCETYVFVPDSIPVSESKKTTIWKKDVDTLVAASPKNVHYFFVSTRGDDASADANTQAMQEQVDEVLGKLSEEDAAHWRAHLHVIAGRAASYGNWIGDELKGIGIRGFAIDREQRIRGVGMLADVHRNAAGDSWPWESNLAYAANEAIYMNSQALIRARLDAEQVTEIKLWDGEVLSGMGEKDVALPSAEAMSGFDNLEVEVTLSCPKPDEIEFNNCGPWDYLTWLYLLPEGATPDNNDGGIGDYAHDPRYREVARFITSYHREMHWVVDATPMLVAMKNGGTRHFRWEFAPSWNLQSYATHVSFRFSNKGKGQKPAELVPLYTFAQRRPFNSAYNTGLDPKEIPVPADAKKVELWTIVTGHGADRLQCAEFCNHQHEFTINGEKHLLEFPDFASNDTIDKCVKHQENGMVPNQGGTWWFGRGGWCPGQQVDPWSVDVTAATKAAGKASVSYRGLFNGAPPTVPPPDPGADAGVDDRAAKIEMSSYLVIYR